MANPVVLFARFRTKPGMGAEVAAILAELIEHVQREPGLSTYRLHRGLDDPDCVWFYEVYDDQAALDAHGKFPEFGATFGRVGDLLDGPPELIRSEVVSSYLRS